MQRVLLLGNTSVANGDKMDLFRSQFSSVTPRDVEVYHCYYDDLRIDLAHGEFTITDCRNQLKLSLYDLVIFKGAIYNSLLPNIVGRYLQQSKTPYFNDFSEYRRLNKLSQLIDMYELGIRFPRTAYIANRQLFAEFVEAEWDFPAIVKVSAGSKGKHNFLAKTVQQLKKILKDHEHLQFIVQEYIPNSFDYRVLVIGDKHLVLKRQNNGDGHITNTSQGGSIAVVADGTLPPIIIRQAKQLATKSKMRIAGVDIIQHSGGGQYFFLEINSQPAIGHKEALPLLQQLLSDILVENE